MAKIDRFSNFLGYFHVFQVVELFLNDYIQKMRFWKKIEKFHFSHIL
jgi:hypothetical protein